jgi:peptide/nickel transport system substrate-binding protein
MLATAFKSSPDGKQMTITTRDGVKWSDGQPFTAKDVAFTFNLISKTPALDTSGLKLTSVTTCRTSRSM